jgi:hypothetical protein
VSEYFVIVMMSEKGQVSALKQMNSVLVDSMKPAVKVLDICIVPKFHEHDTRE